MNNKYNAIQILIKVYKQTLKAVPFSGIIGFLNYFIQGLIPAFTAILLSKLFDTAYKISQNSGEIKVLYFYSSFFVLTYAISYIVQLISSITINAGIYERCTSYYNMMISNKSSKLPLIYFENTDILNLQNRAKDCVSREILSQIYMSSAVFITSGISVISVVAVLSSYNFWLVPISILSVIPYFIARIIRGKEFYYLKRHQSKKTRKLKYLWSLFNAKQTVKEMRIMGFDNYVTDRWAETRENINEELWSQNIKDSKLLFLCDSIKTIGYSLSVIFALLLVLNGKISFGIFAACIAAFKSVQESTKSFLIDLGNMPEKVAFANDFFEFQDLHEVENGIINYNGLKNSIEIKMLNFCYPNNENFALKDVSLTIKKGETIVILGENGSGKTTLSKIILGLYEATEGDILYDKISIKKFNKETFYKKISAIPQNFITYNLSLRENVAMSDISNIYNDQKIIDTLFKVGSEQIASNGLDIQLGREFGGIELSGGQWQKVAIARCLFKNSELIVLDEPTSALDPIIENEILKKFIEIAKNKTAIIISHRVGICKIADRIIVLKNGEVCEIGNHIDLINRKKEYYKLYTSQEQWYK